jgi:hypothetical protein
MKDTLNAEEISKSIEQEAKGHPLLLMVIRSERDRKGLDALATEVSKKLKGKVIRSAYTPNSELFLYEIRRKGLTVVLLVLKGSREKIETISPTTDDEIAEIESNIYSSNINDVYVRLVSDIF